MASASPKPIEPPLPRHLRPHQPLGLALALAGAVASAGMAVPAEMLLRALTLKNRNYLPIWFHRGVARALGVRIHCHGRPARRHAVLYVANHLSWSDIPVLGARIRAVFVAKSDVAGWGPVGWLASFANTIYVARDRRQSTAAQKDSIAGRLAAGDSVILFPEGTNSDGVDVLPFKSALFSVVADVEDLLIQPVTLAYTRINGMPVTRRQLPSVAWVGDTALGPHVKEFATLGRVRADIIFHPAVRAADFPDRKALARHCEAVVRAGYRQLMRG